MQFLASSAFGLEGLVKQDLVRLGAQSIMPQPTGGVLFEGPPEMGFKANLWLRTADRVLMVMGRFTAKTFDELFEGVRALAWEDYLPDDAALPIKAQCARSQLMSPSDCQAIAKKAIVRRMQEKRGLNWLSESGAPYQVDVSLHADQATVAINMSGAALNRRGYRTWNGEAPLRETLAAAMVIASPWRPKLALVDPCCGTGTILIEAAFVALDRAPGLTRTFDCEDWAFMDKGIMAQMRSESRVRFQEGLKRPLDISGSDVDPAAIELAERHVQQAGLEGRIALERRDVRHVNLPQSGGAIITNPPYGERMGDRQAAQAVAKQLGLLYKRSPGWTLSALSADRGFEKAFGKLASKRRRLYNGRIECEFKIYKEDNQP